MARILFFSISFSCISGTTVCLVKSISMTIVIGRSLPNIYKIQKWNTIDIGYILYLYKFVFGYQFEGFN